MLLPAPTSFQFLKCFIPEESSHQILVLDTFFLLSKPWQISSSPFLLIIHLQDPTLVFPQDKSLPLITGYWPPFHLHQCFLNWCLRTSVWKHQVGQVPYRCKLPPSHLVLVAPFDIFWAWLRKELAFCPSQAPALNCSVCLPTDLFPPHPWSCWELSLLTKGAISMGRKAG